MEGVTLRCYPRRVARHGTVVVILDAVVVPGSVMVAAGISVVVVRHIAVINILHV